VRVRFSGTQSKRLLFVLVLLIATCMAAAGVWLLLRPE
jgi:hypothetical protein